MAGVSMKDIRSRIRSMESTKQITRAMEMVAASKLRGAQERAAASRPYFEILYETMNQIADSTMDFVSPYLKEREGRTLHIVIAGDRGLAGGYNSNILKLAYAGMDAEHDLVLPVGKKALEFFRARGVETLTERYAQASEVSIGDCYSVAKLLCTQFLDGKFAKVELAYTNFASCCRRPPRWSCCRCASRKRRIRARQSRLFCMRPARWAFLTPSCRNIWEAFSTARCASPSPPSRRRAAWRWTPPPKTPTR